MSALSRFSRRLSLRAPYERRPAVQVHDARQLARESCRRDIIQCLPGARYRLCAFAPFSATALNSAPVQARAVVTWEIVPAATGAIIAPMMVSASLASAI